MRATRSGTRILRHVSVQLPILSAVAFLTRSGTLKTRNVNAIPISNGTSRARNASVSNTVWSPKEERCAC